MKNYALISGASEGLGNEFAEILAADGYNLLLTARNSLRLRRIQERLTARYRVKVKIVALDLSRPDAPEEIFEYSIKNGITIDLLINNAGFGNYGYFADTDIETEISMINLNIGALTKMCKLFLPAMIGRGFGRIMNVASTASFFPGPKMSVYYATKSYVLSFSESLNAELKKHNISVTAFCPGPTATRFMERANITNSRLFNNPLMRVMSAREAAEYGYRALLKGKAVAVPGLMNKLLTLSPRFFPKSIIRLIMNGIMEGRSDR
jgi:short-subunit dehydrogenase